MSSLDERNDSDLTDEERRWLAVDHYLAGDASAEDILLAREWCGDKSAVEVIEALRRIREALGKPALASDVDAAWGRLRARLLSEHSAPTTRVPDGARPPIVLLRSEASPDGDAPLPRDAADDERDR